MQLNCQYQFCIRLGAPNFPDELREYLFAEANIQKMTSLDVKNLLRDFENGGFTAIKDSIEVWNEKTLTYRHMRYAVNICEDVVRYIGVAKNKLVYKYGKAEGKLDMTEIEELRDKMIEALDIAASGISSWAFNVEDKIRHYEDEMKKDEISEDVDFTEM